MPEKRGSHRFKTATMGGVGIFFGFALTFAFIGAILSKYLEMNILFDLGASLIIMFVIGIEDDLLVISPLKKMMAQLLAAAIVIVFLGIRITTFNGFLGIYSLPYLPSLVFTFLTFVLVINAYNLIDGIDGLAGIIAAMICLFFGIYFLANKEFTQVLISFALLGSLIAFLKFNTSHKRKIFMGDTGSMVIGFVIVYQAIIFLNVNNDENTIFSFNNGPVFIIAMLSFPLLDILRLFFIRIKNGKDSFKSDENHIHTCFLDSGATHIETTIVISTITLIIIFCAFLMEELNINLSMFLIVILTIMGYLPITFKSHYQI
ncbi:MraY family glycosyltransferase [Flavobacterium sp. DG2-3]|uniref:MraY family glycosyltransferase n=1 Tax=Flavobacterium sp. DG2-3 TaxID=3068317 RepID=UPI00273DE49F|nr:MraY family glycosyltransferase [Flavobacterium sp. DG2-3]MDP5199129.1 MraY family glycosyltransferase [Flavobacterium sp. DG2-3]